MGAQGAASQKKALLRAPDSFVALSCPGCAELDFFARALRHIKASAPASDGRGARASSNTKRGWRSGAPISFKAPSPRWPARGQAQSSSPEAIFSMLTAPGSRNSRQRPHPACAVLRAAACRTSLDITSVWTDSQAHRRTRVAPELSWGYRTRATGVSGEGGRGGGVFGRRGRSYETWRQRLAQTLRFTGMTAVEVLGRGDELTDGTVGSIDATTVAGIGPYRKPRFRPRGSPTMTLAHALGSARYGGDVVTSPDSSSLCSLLRLLPTPAHLIPCGSQA